MSTGDAGYSISAILSLTPSIVVGWLHGGKAHLWRVLTTRGILDCHCSAFSLGCTTGIVHDIGHLIGHENAREKYSGFKLLIECIATLMGSWGS